MSDINVTFCRVLLRNVMDDIKKVTSPAERKAAWVYHFFAQDWEFHGPDGFYWHGHADNAYHAKAQGWSAWWSKVTQDGTTERMKDLGNKLRTSRRAGE